MGAEGGGVMGLPWLGTTRVGSTGEQDSFCLVKTILLVTTVRSGPQDIPRIARVKPCHTRSKRPASRSRESHMPGVMILSP